MICSYMYNSPAGDLLLKANEEGLLCASFNEEFHGENSENQVIKDAVSWLDIYFNGKIPDYNVPLVITGTEFQKRVWDYLLKIPYGETMSYGEIGKMIAKDMGKEKMSAQAVGNAVGKNNHVIFIPCHRVIGKDGSLTGFSAGIDKKIFLLDLEKIPYKK